MNIVYLQKILNNNLFINPNESVRNYVLNRKKKGVYSNETFIEVIKNNTINNITLTRNKLEQLITKRKNVNEVDSNGNTPLHWAVKKDLYNIIVLLIQNGAGINIKNTEANTPLHLAVMMELETIVKLLLDIGYGTINNNITNKYRVSPSTIILNKALFIKSINDKDRKYSINEIMKMFMIELPKKEYNTTNTTNTNPTFTEIFKSDGECTVCGEKLSTDICIVQKCKHLFHCNCIISWLGKTKECPICRQPVIGLIELDPNKLNNNTNSFGQKKRKN